MNTDYLIIVVAAFIINAIILLLIIKWATKSKRLLENSNIQLNILLQMALQSGVDPLLLDQDIKRIDEITYNKASSDVASSRITTQQYRDIQKRFESKYPKKETV